MYLSIALSLLAITIGLYYIYVKQRLRYFEKHEILHVPPVPFVGNMGPLITKRCTMNELIRKSYYIHPDAKYVGLYEFTSPILILRDPDLIKSVTTKNFEQFGDHKSLINKNTDPLLSGVLTQLRGNEWKEERSAFTPAFTSSKIKSMFTLMADCASRFADSLARLPENERNVEMKNLLRMYANDVFANCVYGVSVDTFKDPNNPFYRYGAKLGFTGLINSLKFLIIRNIPSVAAALRIGFLGKDVCKFFEKQVVNTVKARQANGIYRPDVIQWLMDSGNKEGKKPLSILQIATHAFTFFFGGFDTVPTQTSFVFQMLLEHPDVQAKLQQEIDETLEKNNGQLSYETIMNEMKYLDAVINETLRLQTIVSFLDRVCVDSVELPPALPGSKPFKVPVGMSVWVPAEAIHTDPKHFEDPQKFHPDRFLERGKEILNSGCFMPFGLGPRMCIANRFAMTQMKVLVCHLLARCDVKAGPKTKIPLPLEKGTFSTTVRDGFHFKLEPRKNPHPSVYSSNVANGMANGVCKNEI